MSVLATFSACSFDLKSFDALTTLLLMTFSAIGKLGAEDYRPGGAFPFEADNPCLRDRALLEMIGYSTHQYGQ